jgi:hypothetical protein
VDPSGAAARKYSCGLEESSVGLGCGAMNVSNGSITSAKGRVKMIIWNALGLGLVRITFVQYRMQSLVCSIHAFVGYLRRQAASNVMLSTCKFQSTLAMTSGLVRRFELKFCFPRTNPYKVHTGISTSMATVSFIASDFTD